MFRRNRHLQGAYTKISLKHTAINSFTINIQLIVQVILSLYQCIKNTIVQVLVKMYKNRIFNTVVI